ncbi:hypothetical protein BDZ89DRAFT_1039939 [Hymenopellis radicata]|nr:hypothetical protein BDZ89DRAFT_1039939 [Hymenopellis radicata]
MIRTTTRDWSSHDYDAPHCTHEPDAHYDYRLVEYPLLEKEHWRGVREIISGDRFADSAYQSWASSRRKVMEEDIATGDEHIQRLERHRSRLQRDLHTLSSSMSPIRTLPRDVLLEVFTCLVLEHGSTSKPEAAPWVLLEVCHQWRQIALSSPSLWSSIMITDKCWFSPSITQSAPLSTVLGLVKHSLFASQQVPLSVVVDLHAARGSVSEFTTPVMTTLAKKRSRIRELIFCAECYFRKSESECSEVNNVFTNAFLDVENACPMLKELDMLGPGKCEVHAVPGSAPNLTRLRDLVLHDDERQPADALINPTITHFSCYVSAIDNISVLGRLPLLKELHIFVAPEAQLPQNPIPTRHSRVQYFSATRSDILDFLTLPSLRVLTLTETDHIKLSPKTVARHIKSLIARSKCTIQTVVLSPEYVQNAILDIHGLRHLDTIALYTGHLSTRELDKALKTLASSASLPNLRRFIILHKTDLAEERFSKLHDALKTILDSSKYDLGGKIETIEIWDQQASSGQQDLSQLFAGCNVKDDGREWIARTYSDFSVDEYSPPIEGGMWRWLSLQCLLSETTSTSR